MKLKKSKRNSKKLDVDTSATKPRLINRIGFGMVFYSKQLLKAVVILFVGAIPENILIDWAQNVASSGTSQAAVFIQENGLDFWRIVAAFVFLYACYKVKHLQWHRPSYVSFKNKRLLNKYRRKQKKLHKAERQENKNHEIKRAKKFLDKEDK